MVKTPIKVVVRTRPTATFASKNIKIEESSNSISINIPKSEDQGFVNHQQQNWGFHFDQVLQNVSQQVVFDVCSKDIVFNLLEGYSGTILCYGQTGAGKTFTQTGSMTDYQYRGLVPRCVNLMFQEIQNRYEQLITVGISYLQIYNEQLTDLLAPSQGTLDQNQNALAIQQDTNGRIHVQGQTIKQCKTEQEALAMIFQGETNRTISQHQLNKASSRSHCVFTIHLEIRSRVESSEKIIISKLNLVDLAGSERTKKTGSEGKTLLEAQFINKSLSFLEQVVVALSQNHRDHIPYRQCQLTNLLKDSIGGNSKTIMIANIWPEASHLEETISTLKFASRMMKVSNEATIQMKLDPTVLLKKYEKEIKELQQELSMHDTLANRGRISYDGYTPEQQYQQQVLAKKFLNNEIEDIEFESLRQVKELFFQFKNLYRNAIKDIENKNVPNTTNQKQATYIQQKASEAGKPIDTVGQQENKFGFGLGKARKDAKPTTSIENIVNIPQQEFQAENDPKSNRQHVVQQVSDDTQEKVQLVNVDQQQAYQDFQDKDGREYNQNILKSMETLKQRKQEVIDLTTKTNKIKDQIQGLKNQLDKQQQGKNQEEIQQGIIDEEEYEIIKLLKDQKKKYKENAQKIKEYQSEITMIDQNIIHSQHQLLNKFEEWFFKKYGIKISDLDNPLVNEPSDEAGSDHEQDEIDPDAVAYIQAQKQVTALQKARKEEKLKH